MDNGVFVFLGGGGYLASLHGVLYEALFFLGGG